MDPSILMSDRGQYFVIKYRQSATRNELRNVGIALVAEDGSFASVKHLPPSQLAARLRPQGILDSALVGIGKVVSSDTRRAIERLSAMGSAFASSVTIEPGRPADLSPGPSATLDAIFRTLVAQRSSRATGVTRGKLLDKVVDAFRRGGSDIRRGEYVDDFLIDAMVETPRAPATAIHVQSFALAHRDWPRAERETGYFLYAAGQMDVNCLCVIQPPTEISDDDGRRSYDRVARLVGRAGVVSVDPCDLATVTPRFESSDQLPLVMA